MSKFKGILFIFITLMTILLIAACSNGDILLPEVYSVQVTVTLDGAGLANVVLENEDGVELGQTNDGLAEIAGLSGEIKIIPKKDGYSFNPEYEMVNEDTTVNFIASETDNGTTVSTSTELNTALSDDSFDVILLANDIDTGTGINVTRLVDIDFDGYTLTGNVSYNASEAGTLSFVGPGTISGDLTVEASNATVTNGVEVTGNVNINDVSSNSWYENFDGNTIIINDNNINVMISEGAASITVSATATGNQIALEGQVGNFTFNAGVNVSGAINILNALVNADGVNLDGNPVSIDFESTFDPNIDLSFTAGEGGSLPVFPTFSLEPNKIAALVVRTICRENYGFGGTRNLLELEFPAPGDVGADSYTLQYSDDGGSSWPNYQYNGEDLTTSSLDNFSINPSGSYKYRLLVNGGEFDGYTSNEVEAVRSNVNTKFTGWGISWSIDVDNPIMHPYVGNILTAGFTAKSLEDDTVLSEYLNYQWYRVKPLSFEMTAIDGANSLTYESTEDDAGYGHICRATGDGEYTGGFAQVFSTETIKIPNMAYVENVSDTGFTLNLYKSVPGGLSIDDLKLTYYNGDGEQVITISDITAAANNATFTITADMSDIPAGTTIDLINESYFWQLVSEHGEGMILITLE